MTLLRADDLSVAFGAHQALSEVSLSVAAGEMVAQIGPNGAGKSTLFNLLGGQLAAQSGRITLRGVTLAKADPAAFCRSGIGRIFQITRCFASMTVLACVQTAMLAHHRQIWRFLRPAERAFRPEALDVLARCGLGDQAGRDAASLAYPDQKRLELAVALASNPAVLLLDEPASGLAAPERLAMMRLVAELARQGIAVLFSEHDMQSVFGFADRIIVLHQGRVIATGTPSDIRTNPQVQDVYLGGNQPNE